MISDVLFDAVNGMNQYLNDPVYNDVYPARLRKDIIRLRDKIDIMAMRIGSEPSAATRIDEVTKKLCEEMRQSFPHIKSEDFNSSPGLLAIQQQIKETIETWIWFNHQKNQ